MERWDRNLGELLQELRVAQTGVQILFAFLLPLPFTNRFSTIGVPIFPRPIQPIEGLSCFCCSVMPTLCYFAVWGLIRIFILSLPLSPSTSKPLATTSSASIRSWISFSTGNFPFAIMPMIRGQIVTG